jgi:hypothetical protein
VGGESRASEPPGAECSNWETLPWTVGALTKPSYGDVKQTGGRWRRRSSRRERRHQHPTPKPNHPPSAPRHRATLAFDRVGTRGAFGLTARRTKAASGFKGRRHRRWQSRPLGRPLRQQFGRLPEIRPGHVARQKEGASFSRPIAPETHGGPPADLKVPLTASGGFAENGRRRPWAGGEPPYLSPRRPLRPAKRPRGTNGRHVLRRGARARGRGAVHALRNATQRCPSRTACARQSLVPADVCVRPEPRRRRGRPARRLSRRGTTPRFKLVHPGSEQHGTPEARLRSWLAIPSSAADDDVRGFQAGDGPPLVIAPQADRPAPAIVGDVLMSRRRARRAGRCCTPWEGAPMGQGR